MYLFSSVMLFTDFIYRVLVRNQIGKIVLNAAFYPGLKVDIQEAKGTKRGVRMILQLESGLAPVSIGVRPENVDALKSAIENACPKK